MGCKLSGLISIALPLLCSGALADESLVPIVESGSWIAMEHRASMTDSPDVCIALNVDRGVAFRSESSAIQLRVVDKDWSLPVNVKGTLTLTVGGSKQALDIDDNTDSMVSATIPDDVVSDLFAKMDHASIMLITPGKAKTISVPLSGSTKVTNAFRTCAGIKGNAMSPGSNPFQ